MLAIIFITYGKNFSLSLAFQPIEQVLSHIIRNIPVIKSQRTPVSSVCQNMPVWSKVGLCGFKQTLITHVTVDMSQLLLSMFCYSMLKMTKPLEIEISLKYAKNQQPCPSLFGGAPGIDRSQANMVASSYFLQNLVRGLGLEG